MSKRGNGEGTIYKRQDGRWTASLTVGVVEGKRVRKSLYGKTRHEVASKLNRATRSREDGLPLPNERKSCGQYLQEWLDGITSTVRPKTKVTYEGLIRLHAIPALGKVSLAGLSPQHLQRLYADRLASGLSPQTVRHLHAVLHRALEQAARWGLVQRNVADLVSPPRATRPEMKVLAPEHVRQLLDAAEGERLEALYILAVANGLRQGELLALRWRDLDLTAGLLQVRATLTHDKEGFQLTEPKTHGSRRQVALSQLAITALQGHRARQNAERLKLGAVWEDNDLVFANEVGRPIEPSNLRRRSFEPLLEKAGLARVRFHDLRHSSATLLLSRGIHPKIVSEMLGHSRVNITLDLYSHVTPTMQRQAADAVDAALSR